MGRKRKEETEIKVRLSISIKSRYVELIKENGSPSEIIEKLIEQYLNKMGKL